MIENKISHGIDNEILNSFDLTCDSVETDEHEAYEMSLELSYDSSDPEYDELMFEPDRCNPVMFYGIN